MKNIENYNELGQKHGEYISYDDNDNCEKKTDSKTGKTTIKEILSATEILKKEKISSQKSISHLLGDNYLAHQVRTYVQCWNL